MRKLLVVVAAVMVLGGACGGDDEAADTGTAPAEDGAVPPVSLEGEVNDHGTADVATGGPTELELDDFYFAPTFLRAQPGQTVTLELFNEGDAPHTFTIEELGVDEVLDPGARTQVEVALPQEGEAVPFVCRFHVAQGMQGAFALASEG